MTSRRKEAFSYTKAIITIMKNKKAVVVGGSNGIGLATVHELLNRGYTVTVVDKLQPDIPSDNEKINYIFCDLQKFKSEIFEELSKDPDVELLMITAGLGRVADFEYLHESEIQKLFDINASATIKIIRCFYERIKGDEPFYCGVMGSVAGLVCSPMFSVYAATKAAVCRFTESVNIELECAGTQNRILNVCPGSVKGTKFNGGENELSLISKLASDIISKIFEREETFIPNSEIYNDVIARYKNDPHKFGTESYIYKKNSGRVSNEKQAKIGYLSGTFDLFHIGHLNVIKRAKEQCDYLIVGVHKDASHKGKETFIPFEERIEIVGACKYVDKVVVSEKEDSTAWELHKFDILFVGSDYKGSERFLRYEKFFEDKNVKIEYFPYTQGTSSTQIREHITNKK